MCGRNGEQKLAAPLAFDFIANFRPLFPDLRKRHAPLPGPRASLTQQQHAQPGAEQQQGNRQENKEYRHAALRPRESKRAV